VQGMICVTPPRVPNKRQLAVFAYLNSALILWAVCFSFLPSFSSTASYVQIQLLFYWFLGILFLYCI
jgi:hypothetical protein